MQRTELRAPGSGAMTDLTRVIAAPRRIADRDEHKACPLSIEFADLSESVRAPVAMLSFVAGLMLISMPFAVFVL